MDVMATQVGGDHYTRCAIQPWEIIARNDLDFWEGNVVKYILRWKHKDGLNDLLKAKHYLEYLINRETSAQERRKALDMLMEIDRGLWEEELKNVQTDSQERLAAYESPWGILDLRTSPASFEEVSSS